MRRNRVNLLEEEAINNAISGNWDKAIRINKTILTEEPKNLDALLRLGYAYLQQNNLKGAKKSYRSALVIQPAHQIAINNIEKIKIMEKKGRPISELNAQKPLLDPNLFINISGKTKVIELINIGQVDTLAHLKIGQNVVLNIKKRRVEARTETNEYIGALPDDISRRLIYFIRAKSTYSAFIKEASRNTVDIFIREEKLGIKVKKYTSFPKNIQDDLKTMGDEEEFESSTTESESTEFESIDDHVELPVDLEELADEVESTEFYPEVLSSADEEEEE